MTWLNWGCGTHRAPAPWINLDVIRTGDTQPDVIVDPTSPFAQWSPHGADRIFAGHVLEHIPWPMVPQALLAARQALSVNGEMLVVGPDVYRTIHEWKAGREPWFMVQSTMEHDDDCGWTHEWQEARHWWSCHEARVAMALQRCGFSVEILSAPPGDWPVVGWAAWQFAIMARPA